MAGELTTLENVKLMASVAPGTTTYDATLNLLIRRVSASIRRYLNRALTRASYTAVLSPTPRQYLLLPEWPIVSVSSLTAGGRSLVLGEDYRLDDQDKAMGGVYREHGWDPILLVSGLTLDVMATVRDVEAAWLAGYYLPGDPLYEAGDPDSLPEDISGACEELVAMKLQKIKLGAQGLTSYSEGEISFSWKHPASGDTEFGIPDEQALVLNNYKRFVVA